MEKNIFSIIKLTLVIGLTCGAAVQTSNFWHEHTDNLQIISIERVDSTHAAAPVVVAMQR